MYTSAARPSQRQRGICFCNLVVRKKEETTYSAKFCAFSMCEGHDLLSAADIIRASTVNKIRVREHRIEELEPLGQERPRRWPG